jgi:hypothetical protein
MSSNDESENSLQVDAGESRAQAASDSSAYEHSKSDLAAEDFRQYHAERSIFVNNNPPYHLKRDWSSAVLAIVLVPGHRDYDWFRP